MKRSHTPCAAGGESRVRRSARDLGAVIGMGAILAACGSPPGAETPDETSPDEQTETAAPDEAAPDGQSETAGSDVVKDVTWFIGEPPASWERLEVDVGEWQWQVEELCVITLRQPAGLEPDEIPAEQVLIDTAEVIEESAGLEITPGPTLSRTFQVKSNDAEIAIRDMATFEYTADNGAAGEIYAYREGEFALILDTSCGPGASFDEVNRTQFQPFIRDKLAINLEYPTASDRA